MERVSEQLKNLTQISIALSAEKDIDKFFKMVLKEAINHTNADGGTIYTVSEDKKYLEFRIICNRSMGVKLTSIKNFDDWRSIPLYNDEGKMMMRNFVSYVYHTKMPANIDDVYEQDFFDSSGTREYDKDHNYRSKSMVAIPLKNHENEVLGVIQLINAMDENNKIVSFTQEEITMLSSLASQAAIALSNKKLIKNLENLLYDFIKAIADAIDRKSSYTSGHINRVVTITEMIAKKIQNDETFYKKIKFSKDEIEEIRIASWMHDVGKITTPVHIMDKAYKLETIVDRIDMIELRTRMIIALIDKDLQIYNEDKIKCKKLRKLRKQLVQDFGFLEKINIGTEFMSEEYLQRLEKIARFEYKTDGKTYRILNEAEKNNLAIRKGTLLKKEIEKMHEHVLVTHEMLENLSFPKKFKNVPKYASSHHEKLNGKGYPIGLSADKLPIQARIIAIADLFEALTASDRPYKKGKSLSETLKIMAFCARDGEIDKYLLDFFIDSELYLDYADKYLKKFQIDIIDVDRIKKIYHH